MEWGRASRPWRERLGRCWGITQGTLADSSTLG
jgi:hypothetical protein